MLRRPALLLATALACLLAGCGRTSTASGRPASGHPAPRAHPAAGHDPGTGGLKTVGVRSGGHHRTYLLYVPPGATPRHPLPLVLVYHGALDTASHTTQETDLLSIAEHSHNMIVVFPQGYQDTWNEGAGHTPAEQAGINDVAFTALILRRIESHYAVNRRVVVATGLSNGALLTELLGCRLARSLTLTAPVEGQLPTSVSGGCRPAAPINVYEVHGTADTTIPYGGGHFNGVGGGTTVLAAPASARRWASLDHCSGQPHDSSSGNVSLSVYGGCRGGVQVTLASIQGGQHQWPSSFGQTLVGVMRSLTGARVAAR